MRPVLTCDLTGCPRGGSCGDAVVDYQGSAVDQGFAGPDRPILLSAALHLAPLRVRYCIQLLDADGRLPHDIVVENTNVILPDRPHGQLRLPRDADLADNDDIKWHLQNPGNLGGHRNTTTGESEHHKICSEAHRLEAFGQATPSIDSVDEHQQPPTFIVSVPRRRATGQGQRSRQRDDDVALVHSGPFEEGPRDAKDPTRRHRPR